VRYEQVNAMLLNEFLTEHDKVKGLESTVSHLAASLKEQDSKIQMLSAQLELSKPGRPTVLNNQ
jgi:hypothetical protein